MGEGLGMKCFFFDDWMIDLGVFGFWMGKMMNGGYP